MSNAARVMTISLRETDADRLPLLEKAKESYDAFARAGAGPKVARARERSEELAVEIAELEASAP